MAVDLTGGLDRQFEYFAPSRPKNPQMRDSSTMWVMDQTGVLALPRVTFDAIGADWFSPGVQLNLVHADGRTYRVWSQESGFQGTNSDGNVSIRGAGPLRFQCIEPFRLWRMDFDGHAKRSTTAAQLAGQTAAEAVPIAFRIDAEMVEAPWLMGGMTAEAASKMKNGDASALMGGLRYEQLCRVTGTIELEEGQYDVQGVGMRVRRQGVRNMSAAMGHCQHSALFPSGRAFGAIVMAPGAHGPEVFNEAFVVTSDGKRLAARVVHAPWMTSLAARGDDASLILESELGSISIEGEVLLSMFDHHDFEMASTSVLHQGAARYSWDGEEAIGLIERCTLKSQIEKA